MTSPCPLLHARGLCLDAPGGRRLVSDLTLSLGRGERVALVGRNGAGKSSLLEVLAGHAQSDAGRVHCDGSRVLVPQLLPPHVLRDGPVTLSPGEARWRLLAQARDARPDLLLLDEPTLGLDGKAIDWLGGWLRRFDGALVVVSHDRRLLGGFRDFFVVAETGCRHFVGSFDGLLQDLEQRRSAQQQRYQRTLHDLQAKESRSASDRRRRQRKKHLGRVRELDRCPARALLNDKRSYAQEKQAKRRLLREARMGAAREQAKRTRRAIAVELPLRVALPSLPARAGEPVVELRGASVVAGGRALFENLSIRLVRQRIGITGPNGAGKTTLVEVLAGLRTPERGRAVCDIARIGYIAQDSRNWAVDGCVVDHLLGGAGAVSAELAVRILDAHGFPLALAERALASLSPGERLRAALICLCQRRPAPELLIVDEPTCHLDFVGASALQAVLAAWPGGLVVVSHDEAFMAAIGIDQRLELGGIVRGPMVSTPWQPRRCPAGPGGRVAGRPS